MISKDTTPTPVRRRLRLSPLVALVVVAVVLRQRLLPWPLHPLM